MIQYLMICTRIDKDITIMYLSTRNLKSHLQVRVFRSEIFEDRRSKLIPAWQVVAEDDNLDTGFS